MHHRLSPPYFSTLTCLQPHATTRLTPPLDPLTGDSTLSPETWRLAAAADSNRYHRLTMSGRRQDIPKPVPEVMTIDDLAGYLQVSKSSLYKLAQEGRVPGQKVGRHWRFSRQVIDSWLAERQNDGSTLAGGSGKR